MGVVTSAGISTAASTLPAPANAADCHTHIYDPRFPYLPDARLRPAPATATDLRALQQRLGLARRVLIQPSSYGTDNRCLVDAIQQLGRAGTRGIAVVHPDVKDDELKQLAAAGVVGVRFNLVQSGATDINMIEPLAKRIAGFGWHIEVNARPEQILIALPIWNRLPVPVVFDHLAHSAAPGDPEFSALIQLLHQGKCWVKISGVYQDSSAGPPDYADRAEVAKGYLRDAADHLVWGTDWPHPTVSSAHKPDDPHLFDLFRQWCPDNEVFTKVLVTNPIRLYRFPA